MYQLYAHLLVKLFSELQTVEGILLSRPTRPLSNDEQSALDKRFIENMADMKGVCSGLRLSSAEKQTTRILDRVLGKIVSGSEIGPMLSELRTRICEDLENHVYFWVAEPVVSRMFRKDDKGQYVFKVPTELMDPVILEQFPAASDDIEDAYRCFAFGCYPASMFHLMRVVELGVIRLGRIAGIQDSRPSWGATLQYIEKLVLRTKHGDIPESVRPYRTILEAVLPQMQAIQRAWRNKFTHVEDKIIPESAISEPIAAEIFTAVESFMRQLATDLPADT